MEEDLTTSDDPAESHDDIIEAEDDKEPVKDLMYQHYKEVADQCPGLPCGDQCDDDTSVEESSSQKMSRKASKKSPCKIQQGAVFSGKILSFGCSECKGDATYSPNDLLKHFQGAHKGSLPTYPCDLCSFVTNEFPVLQRHRIGHRNTLVTCEICNDNVQYSLLLLTRHFIMCHSLNGHFHCEKCEFSTMDAGTFVQHIHHHNESKLKCVKCQHMSSSRAEFQRHLKIHSGTFPFTCQVCGYGAARREYLTKHMTTVHGEEVDRKNVWRAMEDSNNSLANSSPGLKLLLKKNPTAGGASRETQWMSKLNSLPGVGLLDQNGRLLNPEKTLEETQQFLERAVAVKKESKKWIKSPQKTEQQSASQSTPSIPPSKSQESDNSTGADVVSLNNTNGLTVLMVKNKISIPPNCTTKVMGFKMVDGKKHLVLKVIPTTKPESSPENEMSFTEQEIGCSTSDATSNESKHTDSAENGENSITNSPNSPYLTLFQRSGSLHSLESVQTSTSGTDQDVAVIAQVKMEEEESSIGESLPILEEQEVIERAKHTKELNNEKHTFNTENIASLTASRGADTVSSITKESSHSSIESSHLNNSNSQSPDIGLRDTTSANSNPNETTPCDSMANVISPAFSEDINTCGVIDSGTTIFDKNVDSVTEDSPLPGEMVPSNDEHKENSPSNAMAGDTPPSDDTAEKSNSVMKEMDVPNSLTDMNHSCKAPESQAEMVFTDLNPQLELPPGSNEININMENLTQNSPNQEVFSFHNYSKETCSISANSTQQFETPLEISTEGESVWMKESPEWSLTLAESPQPPSGHCTEEGTGSGEAGTTEEADLCPYRGDTAAMERMSDSDIKMDECKAIVDDQPTSMPTETENHGPIHQDHPIIKIEEESVPVSDRPAGSKSSSSALGRILEEHSDAIISHQLEKERIGCTASSMDPVIPSKTTLRILKTSEGKQQMFLQTAENRYAVPVQLTGNPGFKLIAKSSAPQINVSYVKPGIDRPSNPTGLALTLNSGRISVSTKSAAAAAGEKGASLLSAVQPGASTSASHYLVNSHGLKGPLLLSGAAHGTPGDKPAMSQPTCYLVQRPVTTQAPRSAGCKLASSSSQSPLTSRPVLAMPVNSADKSTALHTGRQAFLVRYISPAKSGILLNSQEGKVVNQKGQPSESRGNKVVYKIVRTANGSGFLTGGAHSSANKPIYLATSSMQTPCFLMSSNPSNANVATGMKKCIPIQNAAHKPVTASRLSNLLSPQSVRVREQEGTEVLKKSSLAPRPSRPPSQRKRRRKALFDEIPEPPPKSKRLSSKVLTEKEGPSLWEPVPKDVERTMRLSPFSSLQEIKCPRRNQPVVVLNHPDADIPEVANIMRSVRRYKGAVTKVALSPKTVQALCELSQTGFSGKSPPEKCPSLHSSGLRLWPSESNVRERFILKLKLRKTSRKKYEVVKSLSSGVERPAMFDCWFCGRLFNNQEDWIGHGQRHLMEATRDWNKLF